MLIVGILFGLVVAIFCAVLIAAIAKGRPINTPSLYRPESHRPQGSFGGPEHSTSWGMRVVAQAFDPHGRNADAIPPWEATDIVARGGRPFDD